MDQEARLKYCKLCQNQSFDIQQGLLCKLTSEKPAFEGTCSDYLEDPRERKNYETNLYYDKPRSTGFFEANTHPTSHFLTSLVTPFLSNNISIYKINPIQLFILPIFTVLALTLLANSPLNSLTVIIPTLIIGTALSGFIIKSALSNPDVILKLSEYGIKTSTCNISWSDITLTYIHSNMNDNSLMIETLSNKEAVKIRLDNSYGPSVILTIVESFREKNSNI